MKLSVSIPVDDLHFLDSYGKAHGIDSRSAVLQKAIKLLRDEDLGEQYESAWEEWSASDDAELWERTLRDGLED